MPGPAPKPIDQRARGARGSRQLVLPASGPESDAPPFPLLPVRADELSDFINGRELEVWRDLWSMPQAHAWLQLGWTHNVALYVRLLVQAELGDAKAPAEVRQWADRLGLTPMAMKRLEWVVDGDQVAEKRDERTEIQSARAQYQGLRAVSGGANAGAAG